MEYDFLVVGAGLSGSTVAERLASRGRKVLLVEKRSHIGGNAYDEYDEHGILVHRYGAHVFHTNSKEVFDYLSRFTEWRGYEHRVLSRVGGDYVPVPINRTTINRLYGLDLKSESDVAGYLERVRVNGLEIRSAEDVVLSKVGPDLYEKMFKHYTRKQWGVDPSVLSPEVTLRIPVRLDEDDRYFGDTHQVMPRDGYARMVARMLSSGNITLRLNTDYKDVAGRERYGHVVYTGPIDYFFDYKYGRLGYRSIRFESRTYDEEVHQPAGVVNYPSAEVGYTKSTEFKYLTGQKHAKTTVQNEYPTGDGEPYYPMMTGQDKALYERYREEADALADASFVGRLAEFKYYNMDQAVASALKLSRKLLGELEQQV